jgi:peptide/nickel transport system substrate-binding protein
MLEGEIGGSELAQIVQANLDEVGIKVKIEELDSGAYWTIGKDSLSKREMTYVTYLSNPDPYWVTEWFTCDQIDEYNWMAWCSRGFDRLHHDALSETDPAKRAELYVEMQKVWDESANSIWIVWPTTYVAGRKELSVVLRPDGQPIPPWATHAA